MPTCCDCKKYFRSKDDGQTMPGGAWMCQFCVEKNSDRYKEAAAKAGWGMPPPEDELDAP